MGFGSFFSAILKPINVVTQTVGKIVTLGQVEDEQTQSLIGGAVLGAAAPFAAGAVAGSGIGATAGGALADMSVGAAAGYGAAAGGLLSATEQTFDALEADIQPPSIDASLTPTPEIAKAETKAVSAIDEQRQRVRKSQQTSYAGILGAPIVNKKTLLGG